MCYLEKKKGNLMLVPRKYHRISIDENSTIVKRNELIHAGYCFPLLMQKLFSILLAQIGKMDTNFKAYEISAQEWSDIFHLKAPAYSQLKNIAKNFPKETIRLCSSDGQRIAKVIKPIEFAEYRRGVLRIKLNEELGPYVMPAKIYDPIDPTWLG